MTNNGKDRDDDRDYERVGDLVRIFQRGGTWYANYQYEGRQHRPSLHTRSKKEARRRAIRLEADLLNGQRPNLAKVPTLAAAIEKYLQFLRSEGRAKKTLDKYDSVFRRLKELAAKRRVTKVSGVTLEIIDAYKNQRVDDEAAKKTIYTEVVVIRQLVNYALSRKMITVDPLEGLKLKKPKPRRQPCWSREEMDRIVAAAEVPYRPVFVLLAETGMRIGEIKHLTWEDVDLGHSVLLVREKEGWKPKTGDARAVPISPTAREVLEGLPRRARWVFTAAASWRFPKGDQQVSERRLLAYLKRLLKRLGLKGHLHTFRHSFISHALTQGIPEAIVRQWVGHVDPEVLKLYTHILDDASQAAMQRLAETMKNPQTAPRGKEETHDCTDADSAQSQHNAEGGQSADGAKGKPPTT